MALHHDGTKFILPNEMEGPIWIKGVKLDQMYTKWFVSKQYVRVIGQTP